MRMLVIGFAALSLAGCGGLVRIDDGGGNGATAGDPSKPENGAVPSLGGGGNAVRPARNSREAMIADCTQDLARSAPQGTDVAALCTCSVERMFQRVPQRDAVRQCAAEQNVRMPGLQ
jgi:hypothetical protein